MLHYVGSDMTLRNVTSDIIYVYVFVYVYVYVYAYVCVYEYVYVYIYICIYIFSSILKGVASKITTAATSLVVLALR